MSIIGERLKSLRGNKNKTLDKVAVELGITPSALSNYESGIRIPRDGIKARLAGYYGVSIESIFFENIVHET